MRRIREVLVAHGFGCILLTGCGGGGESIPSGTSAENASIISARAEKEAQERQDREARNSGKMGDREYVESQARKHEEAMSAIRARQMAKEMAEAERAAKIQAGLEQPRMTEEEKAKRLIELRRKNEEVKHWQKTHELPPPEPEIPPEPEVHASSSPGADFSGIKSIAVVPGKGLSEVPLPVEDAIGQALLRKGYRMIERATLETLLKEGDFQRDMGLTEEANMARMGKMLNAEAVLIVRVERIGGRGTNFSARMVQVERAEVFWMGDVMVTPQSGKEDEELSRAVRAVASRLPERLAGR